MLKFHEKRKVKQFLYSKLVLLMLGFVVVGLSMAAWGVFQKERMTHAKRMDKERELAELRKREVELRSEIERLETRRGLEQELRSKFEVGRRGEGVIVIVDPKESEQETSTKRTGGFFQKFLDLFNLRD